MSQHSDTHSSHSATPPRPSSFLTSRSCLPHHAHTLVARTRSPLASAASSSSGVGTRNSPVALTDSPPPSVLWHDVHTITSSPPSSVCAQIGQFTRPAYPSLWARTSPQSTPDAQWARGRTTTIWVPLPISLATSMWPWCSATIAWQVARPRPVPLLLVCLLYTSDAADDRSSVDLGGRRIIKKK